MRITLLLGAEDHPTDGVRDFADRLAAALCERGTETSIRRLPWELVGWREAFKQLGSMEADVVLLQYTHLAWSRRGFPVGAVRVLRAIERAGARAGVVLHDPSPFSGTRARDRVRTSVQRWTVRRLARACSPVFSTLEPQVAPVLDGVRPFPVFVPAGSNVPGVEVFPNDDGVFRVAVFSITERDAAEARHVASIVARFAELISSPVELIVFGRGAPEAEGVLREALHTVPLRVMGVIPAEKIASILSGSDAMLFVRGPASSRRGSIVAAIANGLPVVVPNGPETGPAIRAAGVVFYRPGDPNDAADALLRLAKDPGFAETMRARQQQAFDRTFSWPRIAETIEAAL